MMFFFAMSHGVHRGNLKLGKYDEREKFLHELKKTKKIKFDFYGIENIQPIWGDDFLKSLSNSKMGLNLSRGRPIKYYSSDRIAQYMGNGLLTLIDERVKYSDFFSSNEIVTYKDVKDLKKKILYYSKNDKKRKFIANNGRKKYLKEFNSENVCKFIIEKTFNFKTNNKYLWYSNT
jgi:spore maturation protein CgeB